MKILPASVNRSRFVRLLMLFFACCATLATGGLLLNEWRLPFMFPYEFLGVWVTLVVLPVVAVFGFFWAISPKKG